MSIIEQAKSELAIANFGEEDSARMIEILELFFGPFRLSTHRVLHSSLTFVAFTRTSIAPFW